MDDKLKVQCKDNTHLFHGKEILSFFLARFCRWMPFAIFLFRQLHLNWKITVHLGWELEYYLNTFPLLSFWNLLPSCPSDSFLILKKIPHFGLFFSFAKVWDAFLIQAYGKIPSLMKGDVFIMFLSLINLVTRRSLSPVQYHHANPFTLVRLHSQEHSPCRVWKRPFMLNNDNNQQLETGERKENKTLQNFTGKDIECCQEGEEVRHLVVSLTLDCRQECLAVEVGLGWPPWHRLVAHGTLGCPGVPPICTRPLLFGGAEHTVISFCTAKLPGNYQQGEANALEKFRRLSWGKDFQGNI